MTRCQALTNLSVPRKGDSQTDLVSCGEIVDLADDIAERFLQRTPPVVRKVAAGKDPGPLPRLSPRQMFGATRGVPGPPEGARPDPPGSTTIQMLERVPEANAPQAEPPPPPGTPPPAPDAVDLPPRSSRSRAATG